MDTFAFLTGVPFRFVTRVCDGLWGALRPCWAQRGAAYERVPGVRWFVLLYPYQYRPPPQEMMDALGKGIELAGVATWEDLGAAVKNWLEHTEERIMRDRVLAIGDDDEDDPGTWRLCGHPSLKAELPIESATWDGASSVPGWAFVMIRGQQQVSLSLVAAWDEAPLAYMPA
jgi:hypothetical protein